MTDLRVSKRSLPTTGPNPTAAVLDAVLTKVSQADGAAKSSRDRATLIRGLTPGQAIVLAVTRFEMEANGGSFDSYFRCRGGDYVHQALAGLRKIGPNKFAHVLSRAMALFPNGQPDADTDRRVDQLDRILNKNPVAFDEFFSEFLDAYEGEESLGKLLVAHIHAHPGEFFTD